MTKAKIPDKAAVARAGKIVRARLAATPAVQKLELEGAELFVVVDFLSAPECEQLIEMIDRVARPSTMYDEGGKSEARTSYSGDVDSSDSFVRMIERRICDLMGIDQSWSETMQGQRYFPGQEFKGHFDWFNTTAPYWPGEVKRGGQRSWTAMAYLNQVEEGGETEFVNLEFAVPPHAGMLLLWNNALPDGAPNENTLHAATPVVKGKKYVITKWFRTRKWS